VRRQWQARRFLLLGVGIVVTLAAGLFLTREGRANADQWSSIFGLFLNIASFLLTVYTLVGARRGVATLPYAA
jgi:hypothetical protein